MKSEGLASGRSEALSRITAMLNSSRAREEKTGQIADAIRLSGNYRWVGIYDVCETEVANLAWSGPGPPAYPRFPADQGLSGEAVATGRTVVCNDVRNDPRYLVALGDTRSEIIVPIRSADGAVVGTLDVEAARTDAFSEADRKFLEECAGAVSGLWEQPGAAPVKTDRK